MSEINGALQPTQESFFFTFDPKSSILSQNLNLLRPTKIALERGARYNAYAELRESKIRLKQKLLQEDEEEEEEEVQPQEPVATITPPRKRVTFQGGISTTSGARNGVASMVTRSVPDFSAALRKENRKPISALEMTTPPKTSKMSKLGGSKSAGEKGVHGRKSYASLEELKGLGCGVNSAINGESKKRGGGGRSLRGSQKTVLSYRQYY